MRAVNLISQSIPFLRLHDTVSRALQLMSDFHITHLPVVSDEKYMGLVEENDLMDVSDEGLLLEQLSDHFQKIAILQQEHFLVALRFWKKYRLSVIPVIRENEDLVGMITANELLTALDEFTNAEEAGGVIIVSMEPHNLSVSEIGRLVESNDAVIVHLVTYTDTATGRLMVSIKLNRTDIQDVLATFERFEYVVEAYFGDNSTANDLRANYEHLMNYLSI